MNRNLIISFFLIGIILLISCNRERCHDDNPDFISTTKTYFYHDSASVFRNFKEDSIVARHLSDFDSVFDRNSWKPKFLLGIIKGNNIVLEYNLTDLGCEKWIDDEYESQFCIQIQSTLKYFNYKDKQLNDHCFFDESFFGCPGCCIQKMIFVKGNIHGRKLKNESWKVAVKVYYSCVDSLDNYSTPKKVEFSGLFIKHDSLSCGNYLRMK